MTQANRALSDMIFGGRSFSGHERHCAFLNTGNVTEAVPQFACVSAVTGFDLDDDGRALALSDWDFDGDQDIWLTNRNAPRLRFLRNDARTDNRFLAIRLQGNGTSSNRDAIGARVEVYLPDSTVPLIQTLHAGEGFLTQGSKWLHFGLGQAQRVERLVVRWPAGTSETIPMSDQPVDSFYIVAQGIGNSRAWTPPAAGEALAVGPPVIPVASDAARIPLAYSLPMVAVPYQQFDGTQAAIHFTSGRPTLVNLWASWCRPCLEELSEFTGRSAEINGAGIDVIALAVDGLQDDDSSTEAARELVARLQFPFAAGQATPALLNTFQSMHNRQIAMRLPLPLPTSFLIDAQGRLAVIYKGPLSVDVLLDDVRQASVVSSRERFVRAAPFAGQTIDHPKLAQLDQRVEMLIGFRLGMDLERSGPLPEAERQYRRVLEIDADYPEVQNNLGNVLARLKQFPDAETHLRRAVALRPQFDAAHHNLANVLLQRNQRAEAIAEYREAVRLAPRHPGYVYSLGNAWLQANEFAAAAQAFRQATQLDPQFADAHNNLGIAFEHLGRPDDAIRCFRRTLELNPRHALAAANLARLAR